VRRLAYEASDTCPELAAGIRRVKGARRYPDGIVRQLWLYNLHNIYSCPCDHLALEI
jgi:hypothetical protein